MSFGKQYDRRDNEGYRDNRRDSSYHGRQPRKFGSDKRTINKPEYVKTNVMLGYSDFMAANMTDIMNILDEVPFDKISIPVTMTKSAVFGNKNSIGFVTVGNIVSVKGTTFTINMQKEIADRLTEESVIGIRCTKDKTTGEINFISSIFITKGTPYKLDMYGFEESEEVNSEESTIDVILSEEDSEDE